MVRGDMGQSIKFRRPVSEMIGERIPNTLMLVGLSFLVALLIALPVGILSALKPYSVFDYVATTLTFLGQSLPVYWLGLGLILFVAALNPKIREQETQGGINDQREHEIVAEYPIVYEANSREPAWPDGIAFGRSLRTEF
jgi:ABC-type dipeptide/oligopeptide/nickel transport system permease component